MPIPLCCVESFVAAGINDGFPLSAEGAEFTCETCGRVYIKRKYWTEKLLDDSGGGYYPTKLPPVE